MGEIGSAVFKPVHVRFDGLDAAHHLMDVRHLSKSLNGIGRIFNSSTYVLLNGELPRPRARMPIRVYARPFQDGCFPVELVPMYGGDELRLLSELIASIGGEIIQRMFAITLLQPSGRAKEVDPHFKSLANLVKQLDNNAHARQDALITRLADHNEELINLVRELALQNRNAAKETVEPIGKTCAKQTIGDIKKGGLEIDLPTARTIRSDDDLEIGDLQEFRILVDGVIDHNRTCKYYFPNDLDNVHTADIVDPAIEKFPNIYSQSIREELVVQGKPTMLGNEIQRLTIMDAKKPKGS